MEIGQLITCPSGLSGRIRGMKVKEEQILTDRKLQKSGEASDRLLAACFLELVDPGIYDFDSAVAWERVLQSDRLYVLFQIRLATHGPEYVFSVNCQNGACREKIEWELDLGALEVTPMSGEAKEAFARGNRFLAELPASGARVWYRLPIGLDERRMHKLRRASKERALSTMLAHQISEIEGHQGNVRAFVEDLSMGDADFLMGEMTRVDFGIETDIEIECPECLCGQEVDLPLDETFFLPSRNKQKKRSRRPNTSSDPSEKPTVSSGVSSSSGETNEGAGSA